MSKYNPQKQVFEDKYGAIPAYIYMLAGQDSVLLNEANPLTCFSNIKMRKKFYKVRIYFNSRYVFDNAEAMPYIQLKSTDESYYKYVKQYYLYEMAGEINLGKGTQKYPLYSNVMNGLGVISGYSITRKELIVSH
ncbi:hypothetical protein SDC9_121993 [bioreactor metagenome]|uniref:Uncharacterized protein n=1 Tax=bioreactor metagenome TaxID=1076179 RepID=A0A645CDP7_9ZZZZ